MAGVLGQPVINIYPSGNYAYGSKTAKPEKDHSLQDKVNRMRYKFDREGICRTVEAVLVVSNHRHAHLLILQLGENYCKLPGGRLRPGESEIDGLKRKLNAYLSPQHADLEPNWDIGECVGTYWRPNFDTLVYPYIPPHISKPKEEDSAHYRGPVKDKQITPTENAAVAPIQPSVPPYKGCLTPKETWAAFVKIGELRGDQKWYNTLSLSIAAGCYISFGGLLAYSVGGQMQGFANNVAMLSGLQKFFFGAIGLPFGLGMVVLTGADLVTGGFAFLPAAWLEGKTTFWKLCKNWFISYIGNLLGSLMLVGFALATRVLNLQMPQNASAYPQTVVVNKTSPNWGTIFARGILCNWLVCLALWQATAAQDVIGKLAGVFWPIMAFVSIGLDHCVANMFIIPMGLALQKDGITVGTYVWKNQIPVTLGNIVASILFIVITFWIPYGQPRSKSGQTGFNMNFLSPKKYKNGKNGHTTNV